MFHIHYSWLCSILGHKFQKVKDLRLEPLHRERVVYRCKRCNHPFIEREKDRRQRDRRKNDRRQNRYFQEATLRYTA